MKPILTLFLSLLTLLSFSSNDTTHVSKSFKNGNSKINIEFLSFEDSLGNMSIRIRLPIGCDSLYLNLKNSTWGGVKLNQRDQIGFILPYQIEVSNISSIIIEISGQSHKFMIDQIDNVYFTPNLPIELSSGDLLIKAGREKNISIGLYALSTLVLVVGLLSTSPNVDSDGIIATSGVIFAIGVGHNINGNIKISKAGKLMNKK